MTVRIRGTLFETVSDEHGAFVFETTPRGPFTVVASGPAIEPSRTEVDPTAARAPLVIRAAYATRHAYDVQVVSLRASPITASTKHVSTTEVTAFPRRSAEDLLRLVPGLVVVQHGSEGKGHQFFLRGFDAVHGTDLELTVEGIPVNEWSNVHAQGYIDLGFVIPEAIESLEATKGPFTLGQGAFAMAGSVDYRLGIAQQERGLQSAYTVGTTGRRRGVVSYSPRLGDGRDFVALEALTDRGFGENREVERGAVLGQVRLFDSPGRGTLSLLGAGSFAQFALPGTARAQDVDSGYVGFYDTYDQASRGFSGRGLLALTHTLRKEHNELKSTVHAGYRRLELVENFTGFLLDSTNGDRRRQLEDPFSFGAQVSYGAAFARNWTLSTGLGLRGSALDQAQVHVDEQERPLEVERSLEGVQTLMHALMGVGLRPVATVRLSAGARADLVHVSVRDEIEDGRRSSGTAAAVSPRATAEWQAAPSVRLFAAYGRGFRPPEARAFTASEPVRRGASEELLDGGDPAITASDAFELGTRWLPNRYVGVRLSGFATLIERESVFDHVSGMNLELNSTRRLGSEVELRVSPLDWLTLSADATYVDARFRVSQNQIPLAPWLVGGLQAIATHESGLRAGLRFIGIAPRPLPHGARGAPFTLLDASLGYAAGSVRFDLELENLLARQLREGEYHFASHWRRGDEPSEIPTLLYAAGPPLNARLTLAAVF